jgi:hypothetical protein
VAEQLRAVTFEVDLPGGGVADEDRLANLDDYTRYGLAELEYFEGTVRLAADTGGIEIHDELEPWIQNLCLGAVPKILAGERVEILYFSKQGRLVLEPRDGEVSIGGDRVDTTLVVERDSLVRELVGCAERFLDLVRVVKAGDTRYMYMVGELDDLAEAARQARAAAG